MKAGQKKRVRKCLKGCKATIVTEMLSVSGTLLLSLPRFIQVLKGYLSDVEMFRCGSKGVEGWTKAFLH